MTELTLDAKALADSVESTLIDAIAKSTDNSVGADEIAVIMTKLLREWKYLRAELKC